MPLAEKRCNFSDLFNQLHYFAIQKGKIEGFRVALGRVKTPPETPGQHKRSTHLSGLAGHLIIYCLDFDWPHPDANRIYSELHDWWDSNGGAQRIDRDLNHFSFEHQGIR